jgi:UDP-N-acetylmuramoylalanine-D-glutamate ligase
MKVTFQASCKHCFEIINQEDFESSTEGGYGVGLEKFYENNIGKQCWVCECSSIEISYCKEDSQNHVVDGLPF